MEYFKQFTEIFIMDTLTTNHILVPIDGLEEHAIQQRRISSYLKNRSGIQAFRQEFKANLKIYTLCKVVVYNLG